jgi:hypothetical protein
MPLGKDLVAVLRKTPHEAILVHVTHVTGRLCMLLISHVLLILARHTEYEQLFYAYP